MIYKVSNALDKSIRTLVGVSNLSIFCTSSLTNLEDANSVE